MHAADPDKTDQAPDKSKAKRGYSGGLMGRAIEQESFEAGDFERYGAALKANLVALRRVLCRPRFGRGEASLGAELELSLVDAKRSPAFANEAVIARSEDPRIVEELNRFNLECNLRPTPLAGRPFEALANEMTSALQAVARAAQAEQLEVAAIGILPTLQERHLQVSAMTPRTRYRALSTSLQHRRHEPFLVRIDGDDPLEVRSREITFEGAATSLQIHLRVAPDRFAAVYNGIQLATAPALALAGNSPTFLGHCLWDETRVALFKQAVDDRTRDARRRDRHSRVSFGTGWLSEGAYELFEEGVSLHPPLLPVLSDEDPLARIDGGGVPKLEEICLHMGTVWHWNRPIYDSSGDGHLRIEMRALPAGPSIVDMAANAAFLVGLGLGLAPDLEFRLGKSPIGEALPFSLAHSNFYRAAQSGLDAQLAWPGAAKPRNAGELASSLIPLALSGLEQNGVDPDDAERWLGIVRERIARRVTGARWQRIWLASLGATRSRDEALEAMLDRYLDASNSGAPVHEWPLP